MKFLHKDYCEMVKKLKRTCFLLDLELNNLPPLDDLEKAETDKGYSDDKIDL